jgi:hypothetical protein
MELRQSTSKVDRALTAHRSALAGNEYWSQVSFNREIMRKTSCMLGTDDAIEILFR